MGKTKEKRDVRISARIKPSLDKAAKKALLRLPKWSMSDLVEEALMHLLVEGGLK